MTLRIIRAAVVALVGSGAFCSFCIPMRAEPAQGRAETAKGSRPRFELTVDSIMRGPKLVGYPPSGLRWSGRFDAPLLRVRGVRTTTRRRRGSSRATAASRGSSPTPRSRTAPPPNGLWDAAHRRVLFAEDGDIAIVDAVANTRRDHHPHDRRRIEPALGAPRNGGHVHAREQSVPRPARRRRVGNPTLSSSPTSARANATRTTPTARNSSRPKPRS